MASPASRKRPRQLSRQRIPARYLVDENGKRIAVVLDIEEYRRLKKTPLEESQPSLSQSDRARLVELALQAEGNWKTTEPQGTAVEIVRRLRDEWKHRELD